MLIARTVRKIFVQLHEFLLVADIYFVQCSFVEDLVRVPGNTVHIVVTGKLVKECIATELQLYKRLPFGRVGVIADEIDVVLRYGDDVSVCT